MVALIHRFGGGEAQHLSLARLSVLVVVSKRFSIMTILCKTIYGWWVAFNLSTPNFLIFIPREKIFAGSIALVQLSRTG